MSSSSSSGTFNTQDETLFPILQQIPWNLYPPYAQIEVIEPAVFGNIDFCGDATGESTVNYLSDPQVVYHLPTGVPFPPQIDTNMTLFAENFMAPNTPASGFSESPNEYSPTSPNSMGIQAGSSGSSAPPEMSLEDMHPFGEQPQPGLPQTPSPPMLNSHEPLNGGFNTRAGGTESRPRCIKCLSQHKACKGPLGSPCDNCRKPGDINKGWNSRHGECVDATIYPCQLIDLGCKAELNAIFMSAGRNFFRSQQEMITHSSDVLGELTKPLNLKPLSPGHPNRYKIPSHYGNKSVLLRAATGFLHSTSNFLGPTGSIGYPGIREADTDQIHELMVIAAERRRAGHDMLHTLQSAVQGVFRGRKQTSERITVRSNLLDGITCLHEYLRICPLPLPPRFIETGKLLAHIMERLYKVLTSKIQGDKSQPADIAARFGRDDADVDRLIGEINQLVGDF